MVYKTGAGKYWFSDFYAVKEASEIIKKLLKNF